MIVRGEGRVRERVGERQRDKGGRENRRKKALREGTRRENLGVGDVRGRSRH